MEAKYHISTVVIPVSSRSTRDEQPGPFPDHYAHPFGRKGPGCTTRVSREVTGMTPFGWRPT
jgi:hypothetical protein